MTDRGIVFLCILKNFEVIELHSLSTRTSAISPVPISLILTGCKMLSFLQLIPRRIFHISENMSATGNSREHDVSNLYTVDVGLE